MRPQYQGFRFLAAALVFLSHAPKLQAFDFPSVRAANGAVAFFFVLSGFLLGLNDKGESFSLAGTAKYLWSKIRKFYPLLVLTIVTSGYFVRGLLCLLRAENPIGAVWRSSPVWHFLLLQSWVPSSVYDFNGAAWFLSTLMFLYLIARIALPAFRGLPMRALAGLATGFAVLSGCLLYVFEMRLQSEYLSYVFPPSRCLEFLSALALGRLCGSMIKVRGGTVGWTALEFFALAAWAGALLLPPSRFGATTVRWLLPNLVLLVAFLPGRGACSRFLGGRVAVALGACSMPFYLMHERVLTFVGGLCERHAAAVLDSPFAKTGLLLSAFAVTLSFSAGYVKITSWLKRT